jgi:hypothetical protein
LADKPGAEKPGAEKLGAEQAKTRVLIDND